jgi:hypothetical protein
MDRMYYLYIGIVILAFIFNILIITQSSKPDIGVAPVIQMVMAIPILIISAAIFYFTKETTFTQNSHGLYILLPFLLEIAYFTFTKDIFSVFKADGFLIRSYVYAIGLATIAVYFLNWIWMKVF